MSRSIFVSCGGDPFILMLSYKLFKERWYDEADEFFVNLNNNCGVPYDVIGETLNKLSQDPKVNIIYHPRGIGNGMPITEMVRTSDKTLIMLMEDDGFIFEPGIVNEQFKKIESGSVDMVGSSRGSCGQEIWDRCKEIYELDYTGYGDVGPTFWPNFFFVSRNKLLETDMNFASKKFEAGKPYKELRWYTFREDNMGDTFVWTSLQLRSMGLRFQNIPQHKADPYEIKHKETKEMNWHSSQQPFKWIHGGSLSASWGGYLSGRIPEATDENSLFEMESRCAFWKIASDVIEGFNEFKKQYKQGIEDLIKNYHLDSYRISQKYNIYKNLLRL